MLKTFKAHWKLISIVISIIILLSPVLVFSLAFHQLPWGKPKDFSDFAGYFSGMVMPALTLLSVVALIATLRHQQTQFSHQRDGQIFDSYIQRFEMQSERFIELSRKNFPEQASQSANLTFNLSEYKHLSDKTNTFKHAKRMIDQVKNVRKNVNIDNINSVTDIERRIKFFTDDILLEAEGAIDSLRAAYKFSNNDHLLILSDLFRRSLNIITDLNIWGIITDEEYKRFLNDIKPPDYSNAS